MKPKLLQLVLCSVTCFNPCFSWGGDRVAPAEIAKEEAEETSDKPPAYVDVKMGYFFFASKEMRDVYDNGGLDLQLSGAYPVYDLLAVYGSFEFMQKSGRAKSSVGHGPKTSIWQIPLSFGLQYNTKLCSCDTYRYYATIGPRYFFAHVHNNSSHVPSTMNANGLGGFLNTGFLFKPREHFIIDLFGEYSYVRLHFHSSKSGTHGHTVQTGGLTFGLGFGYTF